MSSDFRLSSPFGDSMILQRQMPIAVWGVAPVGRKIAVSICGQNAETTAGPDGRWMLKLKPMEAGGPYELAASCEGQKILCSDVLIGEVWLCSGQSNMEFPLATCNNAAQEIAEANYPQIRLFHVERASSPIYKERCGGRWHSCSPQAAGDFSGVGYFFGRHLHRQLGVPIGLIGSAVGGSLVQTWTSLEAMQSPQAGPDVIKEVDCALDGYKTFVEKYRNELNLETPLPVWKDTGNEGEKLGWAAPDFNDGNWPKIKVPGYWEPTEVGDIDGAVWFRRTVEIPAAWADKELTIELGAIDDFDHTYFEGALVGTSGCNDPNSYLKPRSYSIPAALVQAGKRSIAVRIFDNYGGGGFAGKADQMKLYPAGGNPRDAISLANMWKWKIERKLPPIVSAMGVNPLHAPTCLFNAMLRPLIPFTMRGVIWYQGESNSAKATTYRRLLPLMINDWRGRWGAEFDFLIVQIANVGPLDKEPADSDWAELREAQMMALSLPKTGLATAIDVGEENDVHPKNKQDVGLRLALVALAKTYGRQIEHSGPVYESMKIEGQSARIKFSHVGAGLVVRGPALKSFAIAGDDKKFRWADARLDGDEVVASCPQISKPVAVRYAWSTNPACCLYNKAGLPALPFRSDDWPGITT